MLWGPKRDGEAHLLVWIVPNMESWWLEDKE